MDSIIFIHLILLHLILLSELSVGDEFTTLSTSPSSETPRKLFDSHASCELDLNMSSSGISRSFQEETLQHDQKRLQSIHERIERATRRKTHQHHQKQTAQDDQDGSLLSVQVSSSFTLGAFGYVARVGVGTPPRFYYLMIDTGSDITWLQCLPCNPCYSQNDPIFDPRNSSSYSQVSCGSSVCQSLKCGPSSSDCQMGEFTTCSGPNCFYQVTYGDLSTTQGELGLETFTLNNNSLKSIAFGCGHNNSGTFQGSSGLLGLGGRNVSFVSQVTSTAFSYCLVNIFSDLRTSSPLLFGPTAIPSSAMFTPLLRNARISTFYYAHLTGISVDGSLLPIPPSTFDLTRNGSGGVIIDSGTTYTWLVPEAYAVLRDAYRAAAASQNLPSAPAVGPLDTCYNFEGLQSVDIPSVVLHFENGVDMELPSSNILVPSGSDGSMIFCLAFGQSDFSLSIIGFIQQQTFRIGFDLQKSLIGIAPRQC